MKTILAFIIAFFLCYPAGDYWSKRIGAWIDKKFSDEERREE